jgi:hypothetical protein
MSKKIMLLALAAVTAAMFAVPATASATFVPLHLEPTPASFSINGGAATLRGPIGTIKCEKVAGTATPEAGGTTGKVTLTFGGGCNLGGVVCTSTGEAAGNIKTEELTYHLLTLDAHGTGVTGSHAQAGILMTPNANTLFAKFVCQTPFFPTTVEVKGNGVLGTITSPTCGTSSTTSTMAFQPAAAGSSTQTHRYTHGATAATTTGPFNLTASGGEASQEATATLTAKNAAGETISSKLVCT